MNFHNLQTFENILFWHVSTCAAGFSATYWTASVEEMSADSLDLCFQFE